MIHYYSEFLGMKDTIREEDMLVDTTKTELEQQLVKSQQKTQILEEQLNSQKQEMEEKLKKLETMMLQKFADNYSNSSEITPE
jgi:chaperonin cofactor prefoldin